ncbi:ABC transporter permease [Gulosibacter faecalis]|jgi:thiamine transport system permease protein|uniref:ABC transporter permease n=1 Tax=Gulosibacter faecalis TaxID=272240 RepID=A0ABW5UYA7_9MICO|nr:iron ABC transporter permease [Gulosibacter faecalis]
MRLASWVAGACVLAFLALFFGWPVASMLWRGISGESGLDLSGYGEVLGSTRTWRLLGNTVGMALAAAVGAVLLGVPTASILYRRRVPGRALLRGIITVPFVLPTVVVGVAFRSLLGTGGPLGWLGIDGTTAAVVFAMVFFNVSVVVRQVGTFWRSIDPGLGEAARTLGASPARAFLSVTLPQLAPAITAAAGLVFLFCSTAFGIVLTLGTPAPGTLETEIYTETTVFLDLRTAAVLSTLQLLIVVAALVVSSRLNRRTETAIKQRDTRDRPLRRADAPALIVTLVTVFGVVLLPLATLLVRSVLVDGEWSLHNYEALSTSGMGFAGGITPAQALAHSLQAAVDATWISLLFGIPLALLLSRRTRGAAAGAQRLLDVAIMLPLGVSAVTLGFGYVVSLQALAPQLAHSGVLVPLAQAVVALPLVVRSLVPAMRAIDPALREAARTLGAGPWRVLATVDGPVLARALGVGAGFAFAISLGEFGATSFLAAPDRATLPILIARLLGRPGGDNYGMALAAAVVLAVVCATIMLLSEWLRPRGAKTTIGGAW